MNWVIEVMLGLYQSYKSFFRHSAVSRLGRAAGENNGLKVSIVM